MSKKSIVSIIILAMVALVVLKVFVMKSANKEIRVVTAGTTMYAVSSGDTTMSTQNLEIPADILDLKNIVYDTQFKPEERIEAMSALTQKNTELTLKILGEFVASPYNQEMAIETRLRVQAIAGMANYPDKDQAIIALEKVEDKKRAGILGDQMRRAVIKLRFK
jgi:hypothetical protein